MFVLISAFKREALKYLERTLAHPKNRDECSESLYKIKRFQAEDNEEELGVLKGKIWDNVKDLVIDELYEEQGKFVFISKENAGFQGILSSYEYVDLDEEIEATKLKLLFNARQIDADCHHAYDCNYGLTVMPESPKPDLEPS